MKVVCFAGYSGSGKTTLLEKLIPVLRERGQRVSVVKHAHHRFDIDHPGKDTWRHRQAGAFEVVAASDQRLVLMREFERPTELTVHHLIAEVHPGVDWVLVEGFKDSDLPKLEVWRSGGAAPGAGARADVGAGAGAAAADARQPHNPVRYPQDPFVLAVLTDDAAVLPQPTALPVLDINDPGAVVDWLEHNALRLDYDNERHGAWLLG